MTPARGIALALATALGMLTTGCPDGTVGTVELELTAAPGSPLLEAVTRLRVTLTSPRQVIEADRTEAGFALAIEVEATGALGAIHVEGFDAAGGLVAGGQSPAFAIAAIDARIVVYMAAPFSIGRTPVTYLEDGRAGIAGLSVSSLSYGAILAGGLTTDGDGAPIPSGAVHIYNAFDHGLTAGLAMPSPRTGVILGSGPRGAVYLFGGRDVADQHDPSLWLFDTTVAPSGAYFELGNFPALARSDQHAVQLGPDTFVITGAPPLELRGGQLTPRADLGELARTGAATTAGDRVTAVFATPAGELLLVRDNVVTLVDAAPRIDATIAAVPGGRFVVAGGHAAGTLVRDLLVVDGVTGAATVLADALTTGSLSPPIGVTPRHIVVFGGTDLAGAPGDRVDVFDAQALTPLTTLEAQLAPDGRAIALPNDQVLYVGDSAGGFQLFTPPPPVLP